MITPEPRELFPLEDVRACADDPDRQRQAWRTSPFPAEWLEGEKRIAEQRFPDACMNSAEWIYFESPDWTWDALCGRAGWILFDRATGDQWAFVATMVS